MRQRTAGTTQIGTWQAPATSPQRIRWGAVFAGTVLGLSLLALLTTLWFALAYASGLEEVRVNLEWYVGVSAILCLFVGGVLAGWLSGVRGAVSGFFNGMTIWAMVLLLTLAVGLPSILNVLNLGRVTQLPVDATATTGLPSVDAALWATFWSILGGLLASAIGGAIGGAITRPANAEYAMAPRADVVIDHDQTDVVDGEDVEDVEVRRSRVS